MLVSCYSKPLQCSLKKPQIKHDFFKNEGVILEKLIQVNLELVFFCDFYFLPTEFRACKAKNLLNLAREFCRNFVEQNLNENKSSGMAVEPWLGLKEVGSFFLSNCAVNILSNQ